MSHFATDRDRLFISKCAEAGGAQATREILRVLRSKPQVMQDGWFQQLAVLIPEVGEAERQMLDAAIAWAANTAGLSLGQKQTVAALENVGLDPKIELLETDADDLYIRRYCVASIGRRSIEDIATDRIRGALNLALVEENDPEASLVISGLIHDITQQMAKS